MACRENPVYRENITDCQHDEVQCLGCGIKGTSAQLLRVGKVDCHHKEILCLGCGKIGSPAQLLGNRKKGPRSPEAAAQSKAAGKMGGWPKGLRRGTGATMKEAAAILSGRAGGGEVSYQGYAFCRRDAMLSPFAEGLGGAGLSPYAATKYIRTVMKERALDTTKG